MILLGSQVGTPAISPAGSNFDTMRALKSMPLRYTACLHKIIQEVFPVSGYLLIHTAITFAGQLLHEKGCVWITE